MNRSPSFAYNGFGARVSKSDSGGSTTYLRSGTSVVAPVVSLSGAESATFTPGISERRGTASRFYHGDIKNFIEQTDSSGTIVSSQQYDAFGNLVSSGGGTWNGPFAYGGRFGYQSDGDYDLKLLGHRYYDSATGRFITRDPIKDGRNWYVYVANNPVRFADPRGEWVVIVVVGVLAVVGVISFVSELRDIGEANDEIEEQRERAADGVDPEKVAEAYQEEWEAKKELIPRVQKVVEEQYIDHYVTGPIQSAFAPLFNLPDLPLSNPGGEAKNPVPLPQGPPIYEID